MTRSRDESTARPSVFWEILRAEIVQYGRVIFKEKNDIYSSYNKNEDEREEEEEGNLTSQSFGGLVFSEYFERVL